MRKVILLDELLLNYTDLFERSKLVSNRTLLSARKNNSIENLDAQRSIKHKKPPYASSQPLKLI